MALALADPYVAFTQNSRLFAGSLCAGRARRVNAFECIKAAITVKHDKRENSWFAICSKA